MSENKSTNIISDYLLPMYASLIVAFLHYLFYVSNLILTGSNLRQSIQIIIDGGFFFMAFTAATWLILPIIFTPVLFIMIHKMKVQPILYKHLFVATLFSIPVSFVTFILFFVFQMAIGMKMSI